MNDQSGVFVAGKLDTVLSPLYDTLIVPITTAVGTNIKMFGSIQGVGGVQPEQTNMSQSFTLPSPQSFLAQALRLVFIGCAKADIISFMQKYTVRFIAGSKTYLDAPAEYFAGGAGVNTDPTNGIPDPRAITSMGDEPVNLTNGTTFRVEVVGSVGFTTTAAFFLRFYLDGLYTRGVQ